MLEVINNSSCSYHIQYHLQCMERSDDFLRSFQVQWKQFKVNDDKSRKYTVVTLTVGLRDEIMRHALPARNVLIGLLFPGLLNPITIVMAMF